MKPKKKQPELPIDLDDPLQKRAENILKNMPTPQASYSINKWISGEETIVQPQPLRKKKRHVTDRKQEIGRKRAKKYIEEIKAEGHYLKTDPNYKPRRHGEPKKYPKDNSTFNKARTNTNCTALCNLLDQIFLHLPFRRQKRGLIGRKKTPLQERLKACILHAFLKQDSRITNGQFKDLKIGTLRKPYHFNTILSFQRNEEVLIWLRHIILVTGTPLRHLENVFCCDSTGLRQGKTGLWFSIKIKEDIRKKEWKKLHLLVCQHTGIVASCVLTKHKGKDTGDSSQVEPLLEQASKLYTIDQFLADGAYSARKVLKIVEKLDALPIIPFDKGTKDNTSKKQSKYWQKLFIISK